MNFSTETEYMNGGVEATILRMLTRELTKEEAARLAAHDAMPRGQWYTESQLSAKLREQDAREVWNKKDGYEDLYGDYTPPARPKRLSAYDKAHRKG